MFQRTKSLSILFIAALALSIILYWTIHSAIPITHAFASTTGTSIVVLEDFSDIVTQNDLGFNDFSGNMGTLNSNPPPTSTITNTYGVSQFICPGNTPCALQFKWNFGNDESAFTGLFLSLFGLNETVTTLDGKNTITQSFPEHSLDLDRIDGVLQVEPARQFESICTRLSFQGVDKLKLRFELKDVQGGYRYTRLEFSSAGQPQEQCWNFRMSPFSHGDKDLNPKLAKIFSLIVERKNIGDQVENPITGTLTLHQIWFTMNQDESQPPSNEQDLLDLLERRTYQYFLDWSSRKEGSMDIPQDRSTFGDLLTVGGVGFALPAHIIATKHGWITKDEAITHTLNILRDLDQPIAMGAQPTGTIGYKGWFYHFLDVDGKRKLNYDFPETNDRDESLNTVELSAIDTGLALMGVLAAQSYFTGTSPLEQEIRQHAQAIYDRVDWQFMLEPKLNQFYLGWKPHENRDPEPKFAITDTQNLGNYSGVITDPQTLDYYTDEALILALLSLGADKTPVPIEVYSAIQLNRDEQGLIRTYPGSLFTYQFLHAFLDTRTIRGNWYENSQLAISNTISYVEQNSSKFATYGPNAWGLSAAEGPDDQYRAYGAPTVAIGEAPEDGTITYYGMLSSMSFGDNLRQHAITAAREAWNRGHWHPRFGLPDAFNNDISQAKLPTTPNILRRNGAWLQRATFAIDQGPMLLHMENSRSGLIWRLLAENPNIKRALARWNSIAPTQTIIEGESGNGQGVLHDRSNASSKKTVWLHAGESRTFSLSSTIASSYGFKFRYSNDNGTSTLEERIEVRIDNLPIGQFFAKNTLKDPENIGSGWNEFLLSDYISRVNLSAGPHLLTLSVSEGDSFGVEIDNIIIEHFVAVDQFSSSKSFLPVIMK